MKKLIILYIVALTQCHISLSMLTTQLYRLPKHNKNIHSKNVDLIRNILKNNPAIEISDIWGMSDVSHRYYYETEELKDLYFRNEHIIKILTDDIDNTRTAINTLKKQQRFAVLGLVNNTDRINEIEEELHISFNVPKDNE